MKKLKLDQQKFAGAEVLSRAQLRKVMGGNGSSATPEGCIIYTIEGAGQDTVRTFAGEYFTGAEAASAASTAAQASGDRYGYDCPDDNGNYEHQYMWS